MCYQGIWDMTLFVIMEYEAWQCVLSGYMGNRPMHNQGIVAWHYDIRV